MNSDTQDESIVNAALRQALLRLAAQEDQRAATAAAAVPYWRPTPVDVAAHRAAARVLRADADQLLGAA